MTGAKKEIKRSERKGTQGRATFEGSGKTPSAELKPRWGLNEKKPV